MLSISHGDWSFTRLVIKSSWHRHRLVIVLLPGWGCHVYINKTNTTPWPYSWTPASTDGKMLFPATGSYKIFKRLSIGRLERKDICFIFGRQASFHQSYSFSHAFVGEAKQSRLKPALPYHVCFYLVLLIPVYYQSSSLSNLSLQAHARTLLLDEVTHPGNSSAGNTIQHFPQPKRPAS